MVGRPTWQGHLKLSLVSCPVALYSATRKTGEVHFNMLHRTTHNRIRMVPTDPERGPVDRTDIVRGFEVDKDRYVVVTDDEIRSVRLESTRTIDIERFVSAADIDRMYWDEPYFLLPDGKAAIEAYSVIREAMRRTARIAIGRLVMHTRERILAIEPRDAGLLAYSLRAYDEVRDPAEAFASLPDFKFNEQMVGIAEKIIEQQGGPFEPALFTDRYEEALKALVAEKAKGAGRQVTVEEPEDTKVVDLMQALRRSLVEAAPSDRRPPTAPRRREPAPAARPRKPSSRRRAS